MYRIGHVPHRAGGRRDMTIRAIQGELRLIGRGKTAQGMCYPSVIDIGNDSLRGICYSEYLDNYLNPGEVEGIIIRKNMIVAAKIKDGRLIEEPSFRRGNFRFGDWIAYLFFLGLIASIPTLIVLVASDRQNEKVNATTTWFVVMAASVVWQAISNSHIRADYAKAVATLTPHSAS